MTSTSSEQRAKIVDPHPAAGKAFRTDIPQLRKRGFTIIETLTVAAICSVCTSILVPAMQSARRDARDTICINNLKRIGLAVHNYHDVHTGFPPGWNTREPENAGYASTGWQSSILPFVNQAPLYNELDMKNGVYTSLDKDVKLLKKRLNEYRCPLDSVTDTNPFRGDWGTSNYVGNFGSTAIPRWSESSTFWPGQTTSPVSIRGRYGRAASPGSNGMFAMNSMIRIRDCVDGTSNTLMVGERSVLGKAALWPGPRSNYQESDVLADGSYASPINRSETGYSSRHANGIVHFLLCDGSARAIHESLDSNDKTDRNMGLLQKLSARDDGLVVGQF
ncbi:MAG: DUF1559 domain-containing protein [Fuerstiella sp.]|nr:DUF1559 domain-containing protein [Fuerstiella sp.]MCP4508464.1 DUF1559 domain-containing protein [Fuerstiella sp.]